MFNKIKQSSISNIGTLFSIFLIAIGVFWGTSTNITSFIGLLAMGLLALYIQFGYKTIGTVFPKLKIKDIKYIIMALIVEIFVSSMAVVILNLFGVTSSPNRIFEGISDLTLLSKIKNIFLIAVSLAGEEIIVASVLLPILKYSSYVFKKNVSWIIAIVLSSLFFGLLHFWSYDGNWSQILVVLPLARLGFDFAWIKTNSIWGGIVAHIIFDLSILIPSMF